MANKDCFRASREHDAPWLKHKVYGFVPSSYHTNERRLCVRSTYFARGVSRSHLHPFEDLLLVGGLVEGCDHAVVVVV